MEQPNDLTLSFAFVDRDCLGIRVQCDSTGGVPKQFATVEPETREVPCKPKEGRKVSYQFSTHSLFQPSQQCCHGVFAKN